jgi:hypothetical protein
MSEDDRDREKEKELKRKHDVEKNSLYYFLKAYEGFEMPEGKALVMSEKYSAKKKFIKKIINVTKSAIYYQTVEGHKGMIRLSQITGLEESDL